MKTILTFFMAVLLHTSVFAQYKHDSIKIKHGYLHYYAKGSGEPVVLMQGNTGASSYYMRAIADSLQDYRTILVDFQGTGRSRDRKEDASWIGIDQIVGDYETVRKHLKIDQWTIIGHSYGGQHSLYYAVKYPGRVSKIINIGGVTTDNLNMKYFYDNVAAYIPESDKQQLSVIMKDSTMTQEQKNNASMAIGMKGWLYNKEALNRFFGYFPPEEMKIITNDKYQSIWRNRPDFFTFDFSKQAYQLDVPLRLIHGRQDPVGEGLPVLLNERMKNSKLAFIEQCGHFPWFEQPKVFYSTLREFLK